MQGNSGLNASDQRQNNRMTIVKELQQHPRSRAELARRTGLSRAAISNLVDQLAEERIILEGRYRAGFNGRPAVDLELNADAFYAVGLCIKRNAVHLGIVDLGGHCLTRTREDIRTYPMDSQEALNRIIRQIRDMIDACPSGGKMLGIGISSPGPLDEEAGVILNPPNFSRISDLDIGPQLSRAFGCPALLKNDIKALALAESVYGVKDQYGDFLELVADAGIGSGLVQNGKLFDGVRGLGHISLDIHGPACPCGNFGCVELFATVERIVEQAYLRDKRMTDWATVVDFAHEGDALAREIVTQEAEYLAAAIVATANIVDFDAVILSDSLVYRAELLGGILEKVINQRTFNSRERTIVVRPSKLPDYPYVLSGAEIVFSQWINGGCI